MAKITLLGTCLNLTLSLPTSALKAPSYLLGMTKFYSRLSDWNISYQLIHCIFRKLPVLIAIWRVIKIVSLVLIPLRKHTHLRRTFRKTPDILTYLPSGTLKLALKGNHPPNISRRCNRWVRNDDHLGQGLFTFRALWHNCYRYLSGPELSRYRSGKHHVSTKVQVTDEKSSW